ncbi:LCP family protein [bacterium]|nr:LCP family protein [bacterium]
MAVIRMSLDNSHFSETKSKKTTETRAIPIRTVTPTTALIRPRKKSNKKIFVAIALILVLGTFFVIGKNLLTRISPETAGISTFIPALKPELQKDSEGKTNILLVGIDTREGGGAGTQTELNTDTIILGSYDHDTNRLAMISYPRDLAVSYPGRTDLVRINSIYAIGERAKKGAGLEKLREVVQTISGKDIQYYAMVDLKGFIDAIDVVGGIDIYLDTDLSGLYPLENLSYTKISFKRGWNHMNGKSALQYSRMRKGVVPASESSDFARAKRQQKVIQAVIDKVSKSETLLDARKVLELMSVTSKNLKTSKISLEDMQAGISIMKDSGKPTSYSYVLDLYAGGDLGKLITVIDTNPYLVGPVSGANKWSDIQKFTKLYAIEPMIATMTKKIIIYTDGTQEKTQAATSFQKQYYFGNIQITSKGAPGISSKGFVYATGGKTYEETAKFVAKELRLQYKTEIPEEVKAIDAKEFAVVAVY